MRTSTKVNFPNEEARNCRRDHMTTRQTGSTCCLPATLIVGYFPEQDAHSLPSYRHADSTRRYLKMSVVNLGIDHDSDEVVALKATISNKSTAPSHPDTIPPRLINVSRQ